jgi:predicted SAM-dependent methyltransferase
VRHRLLFAAVGRRSDLGIDALVRGKRVLHFAPEAIVTKALMHDAGKYVTADFHKQNVDLRLDMSDMRALADGSFDLVVACDVLEHVPDDSAALREVHRILSTQGWAILTVPQKDHLPSKYEDPAMATPEQRKVAFGQEDHLRIYGDDFGRYLETHGFTVTVVDESSFDAELVKRHVLFPPILSDHPLATNHRRIYFARKRGA